MSQPAHQVEWAHHIALALHQAGVTDLIVSPGSRSTPVLLAALASPLRCRAIIDERVAAFFALGIARYSHRPVALLCTSGTAACHWLAALVEAKHSQIPLIAITADRPPELHDCGAPQTIDQLKLFGDHVHHHATLDSNPRATARKVTQAVLASQWPVAGPVHLNAPARKPLTENAPWADARPRCTRISIPTTVPDPAAVDRVRVACQTARRGVITCGPTANRTPQYREAVCRLARQTGFPVLVEAVSQLKFPAPRTVTCIENFDVLYDQTEFAQTNTPELVLQVGQMPVSAAWQRVVPRAPERFIVCDAPWPDPASNATEIIVGNVPAILRDIAEGLPSTVELSPWATTLSKASDRAWQCAAAQLPASEQAPLTEAQAMATCVAATPAGAALILGNSLPVRTVDTYIRGCDKHLAVISQRGASGIDGFVSSAAGTASIRSAPVIAVIGDVTFSHDLSGLAAARDLACALVLVILDNGGGRIFDQLPIATAAEPAAVEQFWTTPPRINTRAAAETYGHSFAAVSTASELQTAIAQSAGSAHGCTVIHARVAPNSAAADRQSLRAAIARSLTAMVTS